MLGLVILLVVACLLSLTITEAMNGDKIAIVLLSAITLLSAGCILVQ